jgi:hypothetical protein
LKRLYEFVLMEAGVFEYRFDDRRLLPGREEKPRLADDG